MEPKDILKHPYQRILIPDEETGSFTAMIQEFPGCIAQVIAADAYQNLENTAESWLEGVLSSGMPVPAPAEEPEYSGRVVLRMPRRTHRDAAAAAERDGVSLNAFLVAAVAEQLGKYAARLEFSGTSSQYERAATRRRVTYSIRERPE